MKKKYMIIIIITIVIILASSLGFYFLKKNMDSKNTVTMEIYTIPSIEKVFINGIISPKNSKKIYFDPAKGDLDKFSVKNGDIVEKGDTLFTYKNNQIGDQIEQIKLQLTSAKDQKKEILNQHEEAKKQILETQKQAVNNPADVSVQAQGGKGDPKAPSTSSIDGQIKLYEKQLKSLKDKEYTKVVAPIDGKIILNDSEKNPNMPYITVESTEYYVKGNVSEKDQPKLKSNQIAEITILSINENINGKIKSIGSNPIESTMAIGVASTAPGSGTSNNMSYYSVDIDLDSQEKLTVGFHVQATVKLDGKPISIPKKAVLKDNDEEYVFKSVDGKLVKQKIVCETKEGSDEVIVTSGLSENNEIISNPTNDMKEGMIVE